MKLSEYKNEYYVHTGSASSVARQAAYAGIAIIWIFAIKNGNSISLPKELLTPTIFFITGLSFDLLQYVMQSLIWGLFHRKKEKELGPHSDLEIDAPAYFNWPTLFFFWGKLTTIIIAYWLLFKYVYLALQN